SEEHTSELQSLTNLVCRLLLEKKQAARALGANPYVIAHRVAAHSRGPCVRQTAACRDFDGPIRPRLVVDTLLSSTTAVLWITARVRPVAVRCAASTGDALRPRALRRGLRFPFADLCVLPLEWIGVAPDAPVDAAKSLVFFFIIRPPPRVPLSSPPRRLPI